MKAHQQELINAIFENNLPFVQTLLSPAVDLNTLEAYDGMPMLHYLVKHNQVEMLRLFLQHGAQCDVLDHEGVTVAQRIRECANPQLLSLLEAHLVHVEGVEQNLQEAALASDFSGLEAGAHNTRLRLQRKMERPEMVALDHHPLVDGFSKDMSYEAFCDAFGTLAHPFQYGNQRRETFVHLAVKYHRHDVLARLKQHADFHAAVDVRDGLGRTALHWAVIEGDLVAYQVLIQASDDGHLARCHNGMSILHYAAQNGHLAILSEMFFGELEPNVSQIVNVADAFGKLALHYAASQSRSPECLDMLLANESADLAIDLRRNTPLHYAVIYGFQDHVECLLNAGMSPHQRNVEGKSALHLAIELGHPMIAERIVNTDWPNGVTSDYHRIVQKTDRETLYHIDLSILKGWDEDAIEALSELVDSSDHVVSTLSRMKLSENVLFGAREDYLSKLYPSENLHDVDWEDERALKQDSVTQQPFVLVKRLASLGDGYLKKHEYIKACQFYLSARALYLDAVPAIRLGGELFANQDEHYLIERLSSVGDRFYERLQIAGRFDSARLEGYRKQLQSVRSQCDVSDVGHASDNLANMTEVYRNIVRDMLAHNSQLLGLDSARFAAVVCGSVARNETSLFSDIEYLLLTEDDEVNTIQAVERLAQLVHFDLIHLGETEFPVLDQGKHSILRAGLCLDPHGIAPRGRIHPYTGESIGDFTLMGTPQTIAQYVSRERFVHERELVVSLCTTAHLFGNKRLSDSLQQVISRKIDGRGDLIAALSQFFMPKETLREFIAKQCLVALSDEFKPRLDHTKNQEKFFMVKQELYRILERFISSLALLVRCPHNTVWDRLAHFAQHGILSEQAVQHLRNTLARVLLLRMRVQKHYGSEFDGMWHWRASSEDYVLPHGMSEIDVYRMGQADIDGIQMIYQTLLPLSEAITLYVAQNHDVSVFRTLTFNTYLTDAQGGYFAQLHQYSEASDAYEKSIALNQNDVEAFSAYLKTLQRCGDDAKAAELGLEAMARWERQDTTKDLQYVIFLNNLARSLSAVGNPSVAEETLQKAYQLVGRLAPASPYAYTVLLGLLDMASDDAEFTRYVSLCEQMEHTTEIEPALIAQRLYREAQFLGSGHSAQALARVNQALSVLQMSSFDTRDILVKLLRAKANALRQLGYAAEANPIYQHALDLAIRLYGERHSLTECCYGEMGLCLLKQNRPKEGLEQLEKALNIHLEMDEAINPTLGVWYMGLAQAYRALGVPDQAITYAQKAVSADKACSDVNRVQTFKHLEALADIALGHDMGIWDKTVHEICSVYEKISPKQFNHFLEKCILVTQRLQDHPRCIQCIQLLLPRITNPQAQGTLYNNLGALHHQIGDPGSALMYQQIAMTLQTNTPQDYSNHAILLRQVQGYEDALVAHKQAIDLEIQDNGSNTVALAEYYTYLADTLFLMGRTGDSFGFLDKALDIYRKHYDDRHPYIRRCLEKQQQIASRSMGMK